MVGEILNERYRVERPLGGGSQAEVFLATDSHMERQVAIKIWKPEGGFTVEEFLREAKLLARFGAPNFVTIHEHAATRDRRPFFVLEYLEGETLQDLSTPLTAEEICRCVRDICVGLQKAHDAGIVHRDLKPSNIMLVDRGLRTERYVILDLGIAKITDTSNWRRTLADATMSGAGTLLYMSPEQCNGNPIDQRTDIYAFGCLLFTLLVHEEPFAHKTGSHLSVLSAILNDPPRRLSEVRPDGQFSEGLEQLVQDCLAKKPEDRPASMSEVEARFQECSPDYNVLLSTSNGRNAGPNSSGVRTSRPTASSTHRNQRPRRRVAVFGLFAFLITVGGGLAYFFGQPLWKQSLLKLTKSGDNPAQTTPSHGGESPKVVQTSTPQVGTKTTPLTNSPVSNSSVANSSSKAATTPLAEHSSKGQAETATKVSKLKIPEIHPEQGLATVTSGQKSSGDKSTGSKAVDEKKTITPVVKPTPPATKDDAYVVVRNQTLNADDVTGRVSDRQRFGVLVNDRLPSDKVYEAECVAPPPSGKLAFKKNGTFTYTYPQQPDGRLASTDSFKYHVRVSGQDVWSDPTTVTIEIRQFSDAEEAVIKRVASKYGPRSIQRDENPPVVRVNLSEQAANERIRDESLTSLQGLTQVLRELRLDSQPITDAGLDQVAHLSELQVLSLAGTDISAAGLAKLAGLKNLTEVDLSDTLLSDSEVAAFISGGTRAVQRNGALDRLRNAGVVVAAQKEQDTTLGRHGFIATVASNNLQTTGALLKEAPRLVGVVVSNPDVGDESLTLSWVEQLRLLKSLDLRGTLVTPQRIALIGKRLPNLKLQSDPPFAQLRLIGTVTEAKDGSVAIDLSRTKVDLRTWALIAQVDKLTTLNLSGVEIDELAFQRLLQLTGLRELKLQETRLVGKQVHELSKRIASLVNLDVQKSAIATDKKVLKAIGVELKSHDPQGMVQPEPIDEGPDLLMAPFGAKAAIRARLDWAVYLNVPDQISAQGINMLLIPPGEFRMGSEDTYVELVDRFPNVRESEEENPLSRLVLESARPQHRVKITKPFYISACEITNAQYKKFVDETGRKPAPPKKDSWGIPSKKREKAADKEKSESKKLSKKYWGAGTTSPEPKAPEESAIPSEKTTPSESENEKAAAAQAAAKKVSDQAPVVNVSWEDAVAFCEWLSRKEDKIFRLPTEAEWEYACRAGTETRFWNSDDPEKLTEIANVRDLEYKNKFHWENTLRSSDGAAEVCDVGKYPPNNFGLHDMHGNVSEWCSDWFLRSFYREAAQTNPTGPTGGVLHVVRGGSWRSSPLFCRSGNRTAEPPGHHNNHLGFRVVCVEKTHPWPAVSTAPVTSPPAGQAPAPLVAPFDAKQAAEAKEAWARYAHVEPEPTDAAGIKLSLIPAGEFTMGSTDEQLAEAAKFDKAFKIASAKNEQPVHQVRITRPFYLATHEVTRGEFARFVNATGYRTNCERGKPLGLAFNAATGKFEKGPKNNWRNTGFPQDDNHPVVDVTWRDAVAFCAWLTWEEGRKYRLPTEAEWEYACRAGTTTLFSTGDDAESLLTAANVADADGKGTFPVFHALNGHDGYVFTAPVGSFKPNGFGLFDMQGNVREWCADWYAEDYYARSPEADPRGASSGKTRVFRGGGWTSSAVACRSATRAAFGELAIGVYLGFRVAADVPTP